jgi:hypothetical protein
MTRGGGLPGQRSLLTEVFRQGAYRWLAFAVAVALLVWLAAFAGQIRTPGAVKRGWAVQVSRVLALAAVLIVLRLLMFGYQRRVPVIYLRVADFRDEQGDPLEAISRLRSLLPGNRSFAPLGDVVQFVREQRYIPRTCFSLVVEIAHLSDLDRTLPAVAGLNPTLLLPPEALDDAPAGFVPERRFDLGLTLRDRPRGEVNDRVSLGRLLRGAADRSQAALATRMEYALIGETTNPDLRATLKATEYSAFFGGSGFNRYGDEAHLIRVLDAGPFISQGRAGEIAFRAYLAMFRGSYLAWPVAVLAGLVGFRAEAAH